MYEHERVCFLKTTPIFVITLDLFTITTLKLCEIKIIYAKMYLPDNEGNRLSTHSCHPKCNHLQQETNTHSSHAKQYTTNLIF